nr:hypothetical protein [Tanacetum cinerariifolium]
ELEENLVTHSPDFQNTSEPSNSSTNVVNAPREPNVAKQDNGNFVDKIIFKAPDSPDQFHCFHCKVVLRAGEACKRCIFETSSQSPSNINHCCYECGDPLDGIFCKCCTYCGVIHDAYQCQPLNHDYYHGQNSCYDSNSIGFDQSQPQQYTVDHPVFNAHNDLLISQTMLNEQMTQLKSMCEIFCQSVQKKREEKRIEEEQAAKAQNWKLPVCYDDDDDAKRSNYLNDNITSGFPPFSAITPDEPVLSTEEPDNSLSMGDEHLDTILATESDEFIKSGVETLIPIPSESKGIPDHVCDVLSHDNSPPLDVSKDTIEDFSEYNEEFSSTDDDSFSIDEIDYVEASPPDSELVSSEVMEIVIPKVGGIKASNDNPIPSYGPIIFGTPLNLTPSGESDFFSEVNAFLAVEDESTSSQFPKLYLDPEGDMLLFYAFLNDDHSSNSQTKSSSTSLNSLLEETNNFHNPLPEFTTFLNVPFDAECESNSSGDQSCSDEDVIKKIISKPFESFSPSPILVKDSDSLMEKIYLFCTPDYPMPPGIVDEDYDSKRDILIPKDLPSNKSEKESFHCDIPPFSRPPAKPPDGDTGILNIKMMGDIYDQKAFMHKLMITLAPHQEKSPDLLSYRCGTVKKFNTHRSHLNKCPMLING